MGPAYPKARADTAQGSSSSGVHRPGGSKLAPPSRSQADLRRKSEQQLFLHLHPGPGEGVLLEQEQEQARALHLPRGPDPSPQPPHRPLKKILGNLGSFLSDP